MNVVDLLFPVVGDTVPLEHHYLLFAGLSRVLPAFHDGASKLRFAPITGERAPDGLLRLARFSKMRFRLPSDQIDQVLPLIGCTLKVGDYTIRLGAPLVKPLVPASLLAARIVTYKHSLTPQHFLDRTQQLLDAMGIGGEPGIPLVPEGERAGQPRRRVLRIKGRRIVGYALQVNGLTAEESVRLQEEGLGGRLRMGCGFFVPYRPRV